MDDGLGEIRASLARLEIVAKRDRETVAALHARAEALEADRVADVEVYEMAIVALVDIISRAWPGDVEREFIDPWHESFLLRFGKTADLPHAADDPRGDKRHAAAVARVADLFQWGACRTRGDDFRPAYESARTSRLPEDLERLRLRHRDFTDRHDREIVALWASIREMRSDLQRPWSGILPMPAATAPLGDRGAWRMLGGLLRFWIRR